MSDDFFPLTCEYCNKDFGKDPIKLAVHISKNHETRTLESKK